MNLRTQFENPRLEVPKMEHRELVPYTGYSRAQRSLLTLYTFLMPLVVVAAIFSAGWRESWMLAAAAAVIAVASPFGFALMCCGFREARR